MVDITSPLGSRYRRSFGDHEAAKLYDAKCRLAFAQGQAAPPTSRMASEETPNTLQDLVTRTTKRYWKDARSLATIKSNLKTLLEFFGGDTPLNQITEDSVEKYVDFLERDYSAATINRKLAVLSRCLVYAHRRGWTPAKVDIPRKREEAHRVSFYDADDRATVLHTFREMGLDTFADLFIFLCDTGLRLGEALTLEWKDCDEGRVTVWSHKGVRPGGIPSSDRVKEVLDRRAAEVGNLSGPFVNLTRNQTRYAWEKLRKELGREDDSSFVWHTCRHTFCSRLAQKNVPLRAIQELARHQDIATTIRYTHLAPRDFEDAINKLED